MNVEFNDSWMTPSPDRSGKKKAASPGTSRVEKTASRSPRGVKASPKGLSRSAVTLISKTAWSFEVWVKGGPLIGHITKTRNGAHYSYRLNGDIKPHGQFATQKAAVAKMLEKV